MTDFMEIVPQHPHLKDVKFTTRPIVMHEFPFGKVEGHGEGADAGASAGAGVAVGAGAGDGNGHRREEVPQALAREEGLEKKEEGTPPDTTMVNGI